MCFFYLKKVKTTEPFLKFCRNSKDPRKRVWTIRIRVLPQNISNMLETKKLSEICIVLIFKGLKFWGLQRTTDNYRGLQKYRGVQRTIGLYRNRELLMPRGLQRSRGLQRKWELLITRGLPSSRGLRRSRGLQVYWEVED